MPSNLREEGLETIIVEYLTHQNAYEEGSNSDYNKPYAIDEVRLFRFLKDTQERKIKELRVLESDIEKKKFLDRLSKKVSDNGVISVIRNGFKYKNLTLDLYMVRPSKGNEAARTDYEKNIFSVTRQLRYSEEFGRLALDLCIFLNGLPIITIELKNQFTKQTYKDAIKQYKTDRSQGDLLFSFKRCIVHFAVDDNEVHMCTNICGEKSFFLPFNKGYNNGAGNPPNPEGLKTDYLWKDILTKDVLSNILENYVQIVEEKDEDTGKKSYKQVFPRYHQLQVVVSLLADAKRDGSGHTYLVQHSAGSGKSNSIAWLAHQLVTLKRDGRDAFDTVIVVTDRVNLDKQIRDTIKQFMQVSNTVGWAKDSSTLRDLMVEGKKIIITIVHKFQFILDAVESDYKDKSFAIIIDEAHSSQNGSLAGKMNIVVSGSVYDDEDYFEDKLNSLIEGKKMAPNASYFAFTATPKNKTLEMFGQKMFDSKGKPILNEDGTQKSKAHYVYTMKQAIEEGFILDVLRYYTTYESYYHLVKTVENDPLFDSKRAQRILRYYVETQKIAVKEKAGIIVEHFHQETCRKIKGRGRAMVVTSSIKRAIEYYFAISKLLEERKSPYKAVVAFSGDAEYEGQTYNEAKLNGFPSSKIEKEFRKDPYRILVVANKFQTGYDEPLLQTMYVDKGLSDIKAVQTLSRLNRCYPDKNEVFVLDFVNDASTIKEAFDKYYKTTVLSGETDVNKLNDLIDSIEPMEVYTESEIDYVVEHYLNGARREDGIDQKIDICVERYKSLDMDDQIEFKSCAKTFIRTYNFLSSILPYGSMEWEKLSIFLTFLVSKLPKPGNDDNIEEILEDVELESYRIVAQETMSIKLEDEDAEINPVPVRTDVGIPVPELDTLSNILASFHDIWGNCDWTDEDKIKKQVSDLVKTVAEDEAFKNAMLHSDEQNARDESDRAARDAIFRDVTSAMELYEAFMDDKRNSNNQSFSKWLLNLVFTVNYHPEKDTISTLPHG